MLIVYKIKNNNRRMLYVFFFFWGCKIFMGQGELTKNFTEGRKITRSSDITHRTKAHTRVAKKTHTISTIIYTH